MAINRSLLNWSRNIHVYLSVALLLVLIFFSLTGITLNHAALMTASPQTSSHEIESLPPLPRDAEGRIAASPELERFLRAEIGVRLAQSVLRYEDEFMIIDYQRPGRAVLVEIDQTFEEAFVEDTRFGLVAALNDLHKGRNTDVLWNWLLDISAVLLVIFSLAGLVLLLPNRRRLRKVSAYTVLAAFLLTAGYFLGTA